MKQKKLQRLVDELIGIDYQENRNHVGGIAAETGKEEQAAGGSSRFLRNTQQP